MSRLRLKDKIKLKDLIQSTCSFWERERERERKKTWE